MSVCLGGLISLEPCPAEAKIKIISTRTESQGPIRFVEMKKEVTLPHTPASDITYMTDTRFAYAVTQPSHIEDYAIVQWIRGCLFSSEFLSGQTVQHLSIMRQHFGHMVPFQHTTWQIDSDSTDPIYSSYEGAGRFALLRWNTQPASLNPETATYYAKKKPPHGHVFVTDLPGGAFLESGTGFKNGRAQNASLEFKTCLFHSTDIPQTTTPEGAGIDQTKAIWCANWDHKFVWDFERARMVRPTQIDPICLSPADPQP